MEKELIGFTHELKNPSYRLIIDTKAKEGCIIISNEIGEDTGSANYRWHSIGSVILSRGEFKHIYESYFEEQKEGQVSNVQR